jgi:integrase/recombinase XerD
MLEELERRNYTNSTKRAYLRIVEELAQYFHRSPDQLGPENIREYIAHLFRDRKLSGNSVNQTVGALRFFFVKMLKRSWTPGDIPFPKKRIHLPVIWSPDEVAQRINSALTPFHRTILMTLYATGVRRTELAQLKLSDIDAQRMVLHVHEGKGCKDRDIVLSPHLLDELRNHYRRLVRKPAVWLFPGGRWHTPMIRLAIGRLAGLPRSRQARRHPQAASSPHSSTLLRHAPAGIRRRFAHHSASSRPR